jgi:ABC-2 type transport system ATP-binding protein
MTDELVINVSDLTKSFQQRVVVNKLNLQVKKGEVFGFLGPNGSGKTTTIRMLCGLLTPDSGQGTCLGYNILTESKQIKQHVGYMTQKYSFYTELSVEENLKFIAQIYGMDNIKQRIKDVMDMMRLTTKRAQLTGQLSGGWKQRVALAACLLHKPALLLLDEPTGGIDPIARREFWDTIHALSEQGVTTLMATHYMDEAERCTRLIYLANSNVIVTGTVDDVIAATHLNTWEITGDVTTALVQQVKKMSGVHQVALFGRHIHLCGDDRLLIEQQLRALAQTYHLEWTSIAPTLEDAFIALVQETHGELG